MPRKSRRSKVLQSKKREKRQFSSAIDVPQPVVTQTRKPVASPRLPTPKVMPHPYITAELRRIGILAGIVLAILIVLALVLP